MSLARLGWLENRCDHGSAVVNLITVSIEVAAFDEDRMRAIRIQSEEDGVRCGAHGELH